jgi:hypothetical protein
MSLEKKKLIPKLKKSLKNFLTDESGKITKKDALGLSAGAALLGIASTADAVSTYDRYASPALPFPSDASVYSAPNHTNTWITQMTSISAATCNHASGIVNGHYSSVPTVNLSNQVYNLVNTHTSHASHGSHGQW